MAGKVVSKFSLCTKFTEEHLQLTFGVTKCMLNGCNSDVSTNFDALADENAASLVDRKCRIKLIFKKCIYF